MTKTESLIREQEKLNGIEMLDIYVADLLRLRRAFNGDKETQDCINKILNKLYFIKF